MDINQKYEDFYYDIARPIVREYNQKRKERLKKYIRDQSSWIIITLIIAVIFAWIFSFQSWQIFLFLFLSFIPFTLLFLRQNSVIKNYETDLKKLVPYIMQNMSGHHSKIIKCI